MNYLPLSRSVIILSVTILSITNLELAYGDTMFNQTQNSTEFIRASCNVTLYPSLCFKSLEHFANMIDSSSMNLAHAALAVSLVHLDQALVIISRMRFMAMSAGEAGALRDCIDNLADSVDEMQRSMREFRHLGSGAGNLRFQISNIQTWVSAALTDEDTCFDDFGGVDGSITFTVRRMMRKIERLTSNSLALFNKFADDVIQGLIH
ncbi:21 kDa protein-like [Nymphaea colorata]|nr:21 kDa protein-like [Nymphaea colorata]